MTDESPAEKFERWLAENPPAAREKPALTWGEVALGVYVVVGAFAMGAGVLYGIARMVDWVP